MIEASRPGRDLGESVYSNFDHVIEHDVVDRLLADPGAYAQHAAWNFCGYVWHENGVWYDQVWRYHEPLETRRGEDLAELIRDVNIDYGSD